jgi:energy-converting hydrogenase A subunit R
MSPYLFATDCEGPVTINDNAFELCVHFIPEGAQFFTRVSRYDDFLADIEHKPGYKSGDTLKLILPFLKAYGATDVEIRKFCRDSMALVPLARETLQAIHEVMPVFIISTSYEPYLRALCQNVFFPLEQTYYTRLTLDQYQLSGSETARLRELAGVIASMPVLHWEDETVSRYELSPVDRTTVTRLDTIFWEEIAQMPVGVVFREVNPVGGLEKASAIQDILTRFQGRANEMIYCGDSITDVEAFKLVRAGGGLTIAFNGNRYALQEAEIACISEHAVPLFLLAAAFGHGGRQLVSQMLREQNYAVLGEPYQHYTALFPELIRCLREKPPKILEITDYNRENLIKASTIVRKSLRGEMIGALG